MWQSRGLAPAFIVLAGVSAVWADTPLPFLPDERVPTQSLQVVPASGRAAPPASVAGASSLVSAPQSSRGINQSSITDDSIGAQLPVPDQESTADQISHEVSAVKQELARLGNEVSQINQDSLLYEQTSNGRVYHLSEKLTAVESQVQTLSDALDLLNREMGRLDARMQQVADDMDKRQQEKLAMSPLQHMDHWYQMSLAHLGKNGTGVMLIGLALISIAILIALIQFFAKKGSSSATRSTSAQSANDQAVEFSAAQTATEGEGIDDVETKLDLARTYIAMKDYQQAQKTLQEIMALANETQRQQVSQLLTEIAAHIYD